MIYKRPGPRPSTQDLKMCIQLKLKKKKREKKKMYKTQNLLDKCDLVGISQADRKEIN